MGAANSQHTNPMSPNRLRSPAQRVAKTIMTSPISPRILRKKAQQKAQKYADEGVASPMASPAPSTPSGDNLQTPRHENWLQMTPASAPAYNRYQRKDFKIHEKCLGEGAFAKVVMGTHIPTRQQVAVKIIDKTKLPDCMRPYVMNEPEVLRRLFKHDNIVKLVLADEDERYIYLFLQFMRGGELYARVESQGSLPEAESKAIMAQLVDAIAFCHAQGICHRDLKLENILVQGQVQSHVPVQPIKSLTVDGQEPEDNDDDLYDDEDEADFLASNSRKLPAPASASEDDVPIKVLLIDFGFAGVMSNGGPDNHIFTDHPGSVCYAAPELIFGKPYKGCPADIYSLGVVLYTMLYGRYPFFSEDKRTMVYMLMKEDPIFDQGVASAQVEDLLRKMLAKQPEDRPTIEEVRRHPWLSEFFPVVVSKKQQQHSMAAVAEEPAAVHQSGSAIRGISASVSKASQVIKTHVSRVSSTTRELLEKSSSGALSPILSPAPNKTHASRAVAAANGGCGTAGTAQPGSPASRRRLSFAA